MPDTDTARDQLLGYALAATPNEVTLAKVEGLADAYRDQVLTEAADLVAADAAHIRYGSATNYARRHRDLLLAARTTTAPTTQES